MLVSLHRYVIMAAGFGRANTSLSACKRAVVLLFMAPMHSP